jgi:hypothetical protein
MSKKYLIFPIVILLLIAFISLFFHYPVYIENALTLQPEPDFEIEVSWLRIIFEPVLGVLLWFNRAFYALSEIMVLLYWVLGLFVIYTLVQSFRLKGRNQVKRFLVSQLLNLLVLVGLWFAVFVILIFVPLHNDRIINKTTDWVLVNTHSHTEFSHDGLISQEGLWKWHQRNGFDAFFITEHNNHNRSLEFVNRQRNNEFPGEPAVFCGEEFSGSNHLSLLGLKTDFTTKGLSDSVVVAKARAEGAAIIVNHWFDGERKTLEYYRDLGADGFEIENTAEDKRYNREVYQRIKTFCETNGLIMNGGVDFHGYGSVCTLWNAFEIPGWKNMNFHAKEEALLDIIKTRDQSKLKVLLLNDRPYYEKKNLFFRPLVNIFNYFRTLNFMQVVSWIFWILLISYFSFKINSNSKLAQKYSCSRMLPVSGILASLFLLGLGLVYHFRIQDVEGFTEIYAEYSRILFFAGAALLVFSGINIFFRNLVFYRKTSGHAG